jgi:hypothetical protein
MVELSRALYIGEQDGETAVVPINETRIAKLREQIWQAIMATVAQL